MGTLTVECLQCGERHTLLRAPSRTVQESECPRCGYLGWAETASVDAALRRPLRLRTSELRRLRLVA